MVQFSPTPGRLARAERERVRLEEVDRGWQAQINDDGDGFLPNGGSAPGHLGLTAMRERAQMAGGWWKLESSPGSGTNISFGSRLSSQFRTSCCPGS